MSEQQVYDALRKGGLSRWGALAVMGNFQAESGNEPIRLEGDYSLDRKASREFMEKVDSGQISKQSFIYMARGWGLAQWTYWSRLEGLYDLCKSTQRSIGDVGAQTEWFFTELKLSYPELYKFLCKCTEADLYNATARVCTEFERPAVNNIDFRYNAAKSIADRVTDDPAPDPPVEIFWPPRILRKGDKGPDVKVLQSILSARGYDVTVDGDFGSGTEAAVIAFKESEGLSKPTVMGNKAWSRLLRR